jgi:hypothetical protein
MSRFSITTEGSSSERSGNCPGRSWRISCGKGLWLRSVSPGLWPDKTPAERGAKGRNRHFTKNDHAQRIARNPPSLVQNRKWGHWNRKWGHCSFPNPAHFRIHSRWLSARHEGGDFAVPADGDVQAEHADDQEHRQLEDIAAEGNAVAIPTREHERDAEDSVEKHEAAEQPGNGCEQGDDDPEQWPWVGHGSCAVRQNGRIGGWRGLDHATTKADNGRQSETIKQASSGEAG